MSSERISTDRISTDRISTDRSSTDQAGTLKCMGCGGHFPDIEGPVHRYMESSPGCWQVYGRVLAREYSHIELIDIHRLTVDAYAVQHPGQPSKQSIQSVGIHLMRLFFTIGKGFDVAKSNRIMVAASKIKHGFTWLEPPASLGEVHVGHVLAAEGLEAHHEAVLSWARSVWAAWAKHHGMIEEWSRQLRLG